jgi:hypothetical protein
MPAKGKGKEEKGKAGDKKAITPKVCVGMWMGVCVCVCVCVWVCGGGCVCVCVY